MKPKRIGLQADFKEQVLVEEECIREKRVAVGTKTNIKQKRKEVFRFCIILIFIHAHRVSYIIFTSQHKVLFLVIR